MNRKDKLYYDLIEAYRNHSCNDTLIDTYIYKVLKLVKDYLDFDNLKKEIAELKDQIAYFKEEFEGWQSAYEWSQAQNAILKLKNQELKEIIKANFFYHKNSEEIGYRKPMPKYQDKIKEVLNDDK